MERKLDINTVQFYVATLAKIYKLGHVHFVMNPSKEYLYINNHFNYSEFPNLLSDNKYLEFFENLKEIGVVGFAFAPDKDGFYFLSPHCVERPHYRINTVAIKTIKALGQLEESFYIDSAITDHLHLDDMNFDSSKHTLYRRFEPSSMRDALVLRDALGEYNTTLTYRQAGWMAHYLWNMKVSNIIYCW